MIAQTFVTIREIVSRFDLNKKGFTRAEIVQHLPSTANKKTIHTFIGKHALGGGERPTIYFKKIGRGLYTILPQYMV